MKHTKKTITSISLLAFLTFAVVVSSLSTVLAVFSEQEIFRLAEKSFSASDPNNVNNTYDCFILEDSGNTHTIAVAWGKDPETTPDNLGLPDSLKKPGTNTDYTITKIATAGFRYCDFETITIPNGVVEIGENAFAHCDQLTTFAMPYGVSEIKDGTFMDCRSLTKITYRDANGGQTMYNSSIVTIGDHAFDSCASIVNFNCPTSVVSFKKSCFQNCTSLSSFSFPQSNATASNTITVESFAFADCSSLSYVYFEENMTSIHDYAFADCANSLFIDYTGENTPSFTGHPFWRQRYIAKNRNNNSEDDGVAGNLIKINCNVPVVRKDLRFPGLKYSVLEIPVGQHLKLDWGADDTPIHLIEGPTMPEAGEGEGEPETPAPYRFAQITGFDAPTASELAELTNGGSYYYTSSASAKTLYIPDEVVDPLDATKTLTVKTIVGTGFQNKTSSELTKVVFNESLVQISHEVFLGCTGLTDIDFMKCKNLKEIGYKAFELCSNITAINLPYSLEYIADYAFNKCERVTSLSFTANNGLFVKTNNKWAPVSGTIVRGISAPTNEIGDYYIDTVANKAYKYSENDSEWQVIQNASAEIVNLDDEEGGNGDYYIAIPRLKVIGERAFHRVGYTAYATSKNTRLEGTVNLILPESLNDGDAAYAKIVHQADESGDWPVTGGRTDFREVAVGRHAFDRCTCLATVEMAEATPTHKTNKATLDYTCSIGTSAFARCFNLLRFQASDNFYTIGASAFNAKTEGYYDSFRLKEIFLTSLKACNENCTFNYPFAIGNSSLADSNGDPIAVGGIQKDLVIYVNGDIPGNLENYTGYSSIVNTAATPNNKSHWNAEGDKSYTNDFGSNSYRTSIPTYFNVNWQEEDGILYWNPSDSSFVSKPKSFSDYQEKRIAFVKKVNGNSTDYIATRFYCKTSDLGTNTIIDLSKIPTSAYQIPNSQTTIPANGISNHLTTIGSCAFGSQDDNNRGVAFVIPNCVETIEERAFFCNKTGHGVKILTYRDGSGNIKKADGSNFNNSSLSASDLSSNSFCYLPDSIDVIGTDAFYGNRFETVTIGNGLTSFGTTPFVTYNSQSLITSISIGTNSCGLSVSQTNGGLYYSNGNNIKMLVYQPSGNTGTMNIDNGTTSIGRLAAANCKYSKVVIPNSVTKLYGGCFQKSTNLTEVEGGTGIQYINAEHKNNEQWNSSMPFNQIDSKGSSYSDSMYNNSFNGCTKLETVDFKSMTSIVAIGSNAFNGCTVLKNMTHGDTYTYSFAKEGANQNSKILLDDTDSNVSTGVLDLSNCTSLKTLGPSAFKGCTSILYVHTPKTSADNYTSTSLSVGGECLSDNDALKAILLGDNAVVGDGKFTGFKNTGKQFYQVKSAVMIKSGAPDDNCGRDGDYYINVATPSSPTLYQKANSTWSQITTGVNVSTSNASGSTYTYWIKKTSNNTAYYLYKKNESNKWATVGDIKDDEEDNGYGTYSSAKRSYWVKDSTYGYILFWNSGGAVPQKLVKDYFYYGVNAS